MEEQKKSSSLENGLFQGLLSQDGLRELEIRSRDFIKLMAYYKCAIMEIETKFNVLNEEFSLQYDRNPINNIKSRLKGVASMKEKLQRKGLPFTVASIEDNLNDVAGIRVICSFSQDVYALTQALLKQDDIELISQKNYIDHPKKNGYRSMHLIVTVPIFLSSEKRVMKVEIQLRTIAMDFWATLEHQLNYKKDFDSSPETSQELLQCAQISADLDLRMDKLRKKIYGQS